MMMNGKQGKNYKKGDGKEIIGKENEERNIMGKEGYELEGKRIDIGYERRREKEESIIKMNMGMKGEKEYKIEVESD